MNSLNRALFIPTNRECISTIKSCIDEINHAKFKFNLSIPLFVMDESESHSQKKNLEFTRELVKTNKNLTVIHLTRDQQKEIITFNLESCTDNTRNEILAYLFPSGPSYTAVANRAFIIFSMLGISFIHRRDSDTKIQKVDNKLIFPISEEIEQSGFSYYNEKRFENLNSHSYIIGGGYIGDWPIDLIDLYDENPELVYSFIHLSNPKLDRNFIVDYVENNIVIRCSTKFEHDAIQLSKGNFPEVGNYCLKDLHKYIPFAPSTGTSALDYLHHRILSALDSPVIAHNRSVVHRHSAERKTVESQIPYHRGLIKYRMINSFYNGALKSLAATGNIKIEDIALVLKGALEKEITKNHKIKNIGEEAVNIYAKSANYKYNLISNKIREELEDLATEVKREVIAHCNILSYWSDISMVSDRVDIARYKI